MLTLLKAAEILELAAKQKQVNLSGPDLEDLLEALHFGSDALLFLDHHRKRNLPFAVHLLPIEIRSR